MSASVNHLEERLLDERELLEGIMPSAITLAMMLRHRQMATWLRAEFDGYPEVADAPPYRRRGRKPRARQRSRRLGSPAARQQATRQLGS